MMSKSCHVVLLRMARLRDRFWPLRDILSRRLVNRLDEALALVTCARAQNLTFVHPTVPTHIELLQTSKLPSAKKTNW